MIILSIPYLIIIYINYILKCLIIKEKSFRAVNNNKISYGITLKDWKLNINYIQDHNFLNFRQVHQQYARNIDK